MKYKVIPEGKIDGKIIPVSVAFADKKDIDAAGISQDEAIIRIAKEFDGPVAVNIFDMDAVTTTSDGIVAEGAIVRMGAGDRGHVNK